MRKLELSVFHTVLRDIYTPKTSHGKGRLISLGSGLMTAIYNVFITGIFYTGFLTMYGISITGAGIVAYIPAIASCFSVFSSMILERIKRRKPILLAAKVFFYALYILATTLMPQFVLDPDARLGWFVVILFVAHAVYALFSPGFTPWFYRFYPQDNTRRTRYIVLNQIFTSIMSSAILLLSGFLADAVSGSPVQEQLILGLRYFAFVLVLVDVWMQGCAKEYPYPDAPRVRFREIFTLPFRYRKFLMCMLFMFSWSYISNLNSSVWSYHLLNHMHFSYTLINTMSVAYTVILILTTRFWQRALRRFSWIKTFGIAMLLWMPTEILFFFMTQHTTYLYVPLCIWQNVILVGLNISYANVLYMNLPEENSTAHIAFYSIGTNLFTFLGMLTGTYVSGITGDTPMLLLGMEVYSVQFTTLMRAAAFLGVGLFLVKKWRLFTREQDIAEVEAQDALAAQRRAAGRRWRLGRR